MNALAERLELIRNIMLCARAGAWMCYCCFPSLKL